MTEQDTPGQLFEDAALWFARMRGPEADHHRADFEAWLARGALHRGAYNRAAEIFAMGKNLTLDDLPAATASASRWKTPFLTACAVAMLCCLLLFYPGSPVSRRERSEPAAAIAGVRIEAPADRVRWSRLSDGSRIRLEPGSVIEARIGPGTRQVALTRGALRINVSPGAPAFRVSAGGGMIVARGTVFDVALSRASRVTVRLIRGLVDVELPRGASAAGANGIRRLTPGETMSFSTGQSEGSPQGAPPVLHSGAVRTFDNVPLAELVRDANATGSARSIRLAEAELGRRLISGRFRIDDPNRLAARLSALFDLEADHRDAAVIVLRPRRD